MDSMSPQQQQQDGLGRGGGQQENKRRTKSQSYRRQSAPSLVISKALTRSKTLSRESFPVPACPETCPLVQSFLAASDRSFLLHGHAQLKTGMQTQDRHLFLFDDILVIAKVKSANHFKQKAQACVREMWTAGCTDEVCEGSTNPERSFVMGWPTCNCVATFSSAEQKERWLSLLKSRIKEEKEREEPKTIPLRVYGKGINTFAVTKTLPVSNSDSTNEVVRLALQQFGIIGNVKDFQLWVISKRDNSPYPLIGHEFPFSIQMSHVRHAAAPPLGDRQQAHKQCRFIVKPRPVETPHVPAELSQKPFRRRRSLIAWAFWRGSSPQLNELCPARGRLFGQPLSCVCVEGALPKPVTEMLAFLYHEGSRTRGIFRRPAGARAVRELRESLDAGEFQLPLSRDHVFIIAGVFKEFLRSIPGSLLRCELHEEWMDVLEEEEEEEEQVRDIQRMIGRLPKENALLLRYLLAVLLAIQGNAHENQMTSFNIAVCIAPSVLWPPGAPGSPEVEGEGTKKVCELVKFMIEHCEQILGEDPSSLFGGPPRRPGTESWSCGLTDSSYDSLENELDDGGSGGSPGFCSRRHLRPKPLQGSLDSILTFSDHDQDTPSALDSLSLDGRRRRRSEPALAKFAPNLHGVRSTAVHVSSSSSLEARRGLCPTKEAVNRGALKGCMGLHPNSWLKKGRRLSLTRQDKLECEEEYKAGGQAADKLPISSSQTKSKTSCGDHVRERPDSCSPWFRSSGSPPVFYKPGGPALSLFKQNKSRSVEEECDTGLYRRRGSEPGRQVADRTCTMTRARLPSDPGLKVTEVDSQGQTSEARFCLSPSATRAVRDYFSSHPCSNPHSSQQVALALVESHREWQKRRSAEPDFDRLLFAEESYV